MGTGRTGHRFDLIDLKDTKIRAPPLKAKQRIVIGGNVFRQGLPGDQVIEHLADGGTIEIRRRDPKADNTPGEKVHYDHDPVAFEQNRFAPKEVDAPQAVLCVPDEAEPGRPITAWYRSVVPDEDAPDDIFVDRDRERAGQVLGNLPAAEVGVAALHLDNRVNELF